MLLNLADFGTFWQSEIMSSLPAPICALLLFAIALYAAFRGISAVGRFSQLCAFLILPLLFLLFTGVFKGSLENLSVPEVSDALRPITKSTLGYLLSSFGDCLALAVLIPFVISANSDEASVWARASTKASPLPMKQPSSAPARLPIILGGAGAAILFALTVLSNQARLGSDALDHAGYPAVFASRLLHSHLTEPLFTLCLTLLYTVKITVLLLACHVILSTFLPSKSPKIPLLSLTLLVLGFLLFYIGKESIAILARSSFPVLVFLTVLEGIVPLFRTFSIILKKRFDKTEKT